MNATENPSHMKGKNMDGTNDDIIYLIFDLSVGACVIMVVMVTACCTKRGFLTPLLGLVNTMMKSSKKNLESTKVAS